MYHALMISVIHTNQPLTDYQHLAQSITGPLLCAKCYHLILIFACCSEIIVLVFVHKMYDMPLLFTLPLPYLYLFTFCYFAKMQIGHQMPIFMMNAYSSETRLVL